MHAHLCILIRITECTSLPPGEEIPNEGDMRGISGISPHETAVKLYLKLPGPCQKVCSFLWVGAWPWKMS